MANTRKPSKSKPRPSSSQGGTKAATKRPAPSPTSGKLAKGAAARRAAERQRRQRTIAYTGLVLVVLAALVAVIVVANRPERPPERRDPQALAAARAAGGCSEVQEIAAASSGQHIGRDQLPRDWNSNPPTSGQHLAGVLPRGFSGAEQDERLLVHNLEHGYVAIQYKNLPPEQVEELRRLAGDYGGEKLIVQPYAGLERDGVALTAWQYLQTCQRVNQDVIRAFIDDFMVGRPGSRSKAPEPLAG